jgi:hypothetical protein
MNRSNSSYPTDQKLISVYQNGTFFNPASSHYVSSGVSNVVCDRCRKSELKSCIGYGELDLCLSCAVDIESSLVKSASETIAYHHSENAPVLMMMPSNLRMTTDMLTSRVRPSNTFATTRMHTSDFRANVTKMRTSDFRDKR